MLCISIFLPFCLFEGWIFPENEILWSYLAIFILNILTITLALRKDQTSKELFLPILSIIILLSALFQLFIAIWFIAFNPAPYLNLSGELHTLIALFQLGLIILSIKHILPEKIDPSKSQTNEALHF